MTSKVELSEDAKKLLKLRYCKPDEEPEDIYPRVANALGEHDGYEKGFLEIMANKRFLPNSPTLMNAGLSNTLKACFVLPIHDSMENIFQTLKDSALIFQSGGGVGYNFSELRQEGSPLSGGGSSSGVMSFIELFNSLTEAVKSGGKRRGASMAILNADHPQILDFIKAKLTPGALSNFNLSVLIDNQFMERVTTDEYIYLRDRKDKRRTVGKYKARDLFNIITFAAYLTGDPGLMFYDRINQDNPLKERIKASNPCISKNTLISTTNGEISIETLSKTRSRSADVYSMDDDGKLIITRAFDIRCTHTTKQPLLEIDFRRGKIRCTHDHKIYVIGKGWIRADELRIGNKINGLRKSRRGAQYIGIQLSSEPRQHERMEHRFIIGHYFGNFDNKMDVHHLNGNSHDNRIENLQILPHGMHSSIEKRGNKFYNLVDGKFTAKDIKKKKTIKNIHPEMRHLQFSVVSINEVESEMVYDMNVPETNNYIANGIVVHNCGEVCMLPHESCCLGSINLNEHIVDNDIDWSKFKETADIGSQMLLSINKYSEYPVDECYKQNYKMNRIGLGLMGFADALMKMNIKYDSDETLELIDKITKCMYGVAKKKAPSSASVLSIAPTGCKDRDTEVLTNEGPMKIQDLFEKVPLHTGWYNSKNIRVRSMNFWRVPDLCYYGGMMDGYEFEYANGNIVRLSCEDKMYLRDPYSKQCKWMDASNIIVGDDVLFESFHGFSEGFFSRKSKVYMANRHIYYSKIIKKLPCKVEAFDLSIPDEHAFFLANGLYTHNSLSILASCSPSIEPIFSESYIRNLTFGTIKEIREKNEYLRTAHEVSPMWHLKIQAQFQKTVDNAVSKTVNLSHDATIQDIYDVYYNAWTMGCKGITVFRDGSKGEQVMVSEPRPKCDDDTCYL